MYRASVSPAAFVLWNRIGLRYRQHRAKCQYDRLEGPKVGKSSNVAGPVPSSTTGTPGNTQDPQPNPARRTQSDAEPRQRLNRPAC